jgi:PAS domain S-box-containing protein
MSELGKKILIIDDEAAVRQSISDFLEDLDYRIVTAENGRIGLKLFEQNRVDLVLVDLRMPEVDGLEVLAQITRKNPEMPLIVVSGTGVIADAVEALHQGAWDYVLKPIEDFSVLVHALENVLEKARLKRENRQYQQHLEQMVAERTKELEQANEHLTHINERLKRIVDTTRTLSFCSEIETFGSQLLNEFGQHMLDSGGSLYFREEDGLRLVHSLDPGHATQFIPFPISENSVFQQVIADKKPVLIRDIAAEIDFSTSGWEDYKDGSSLVFPLPDESGEITAILTLHSKTPPPFIEQDKEIGSILASYSCEALRAVRATESLRENEQQFRSILDNIRAGIIIVEIETKEIAYVNPTAAEMIESSAKKVIGSICHDILCSLEKNGCPVLDLGQGQKMDSSEQILKTSTGRELPILKTTTRTIYRGKECLLESFVDLTAQKMAAAEKIALETQLRQAQKMEALGTLAGGIAHDFNNILSAVIGYTELSFLDLADPSDPLHQKLESILHAGNRAKELVSQILTFSRMKEQILTPVSIAPIVKEALKLLQASLPANIELKDQISTQQKVMADPTQIHQIIMNLCTNAYHAMEEKGGLLSVALTATSFDDPAFIPHADLSPGPYLQLTIEDTGTGISPVVMDSIFDPYFSTKDKNKGTGLGLAVVHGIVKSHDGAISVNSRMGVGSVFRVVLPAVEDATDDENIKRPSLPRGDEKVLLVDDEKALVDIGCKMLERLGYDVKGVVGSIEALEIFKLSPERFDLVVTDLNMPGMAGDRLAQEITRIRPGVPIILCTGFSDRVDEKRARSLGIQKRLMKPLTMNSMATAVRSVLDES